MYPLSLTLSEHPHGGVAAAVGAGVSSTGHVAVLGFTVPVNIACVVSTPALVTVLQAVVGEVLACGGTTLYDTRKARDKQSGTSMRPSKQGKQPLTTVTR